MARKISLAKSFSFIIASLVYGTLISTAAALAGAEGPKAQHPTHLVRTGQLPLYFVENQGQTDPRVAYYVQGLNKIIYFCGDGMTLVLHEPQQEKSRQAAIAPMWDGPANSISRVVVKFDFVGANHNVVPTGEEPAAARISYFKAAPEKWTRGAKTYTRLLYADLWPGIDLVYSGTVDRLKYRFVVKAGADPAQIKLRYRGAESVSLNDEGELEVRTTLVSFHDEKPLAYQETDGQIAEVPVDYELAPKNSTAIGQYGFHLGAYDAAKPLIIDPAILVYAGFIGGSGDDRGNAIAVDAEGNAYITGETNSSELTFPETVGPDITHNGGIDAFVAKVNATGTALLYAGFIGGSGDDRGNAIAVDAAGNAYIAGETNSSELTFPETVGPDITHNGGVDAFVAKVNATGTALLYAGFIGGSGDDRGNAIAVDAEGNAYITGETNSSELTFPETVGPDITHNGGVDAFVAKVDPTGAALLYAGFIGGSGDDRGNAIAVDAAGNAYIAGETNSTQATFPDGNGFGTIPGVDLTHNGGVDAFVAKVDPTGATLLYAGYIGGSGDDRGNGIAVDADGNAYITGETSSTQTTFPGGAGFGVIPGFDLTHNGSVDAFVAELDAAGTTLVFAAYIGGAGDDRGKGIAVDAAGDVYIAGETNSMGTTFPAKTGPDLAQNLGFDAFVAKICNSVCIDLSVTQSDSPDPVRAGDNVAYTITVHNNGPNDATGVQLTDTLASSLILVSVTSSSGSCALGAPIVCDLGNMASGSSITVNVVVTTTVAGTVVSTASVTADQTDTDLVNNSDVENTVVTLPDLLAPVLNAAAAVIPGDALVITDTTKNNGSLSAAPSTTKFYLSTDNKFDAGGDVELGSRPIPELAAKQASTGSTTVTIPLGTPLGNYFLIAVADADNMIAETKDTNKKTRKLSVTRPDLTISRLQSPSSAAAGSSLVVKETTSNKAAVSAGGSTTNFYLSADAILDGSDVLLGSRDVAALSPKSNSAASTMVDIPLTTLSGKYYLIAVCDSTDAVVEVNEGNNTRSKKITITP